MRERLRSMQSGVQRIEQGAAGLILLLILGTMVAQVAARYLFRAPFSWSEELCRFGLVWLTFLAASSLMAQQRHICVDLWSSYLTASARRWADVAVHGLVAATCVVLLIGSGPFVWYVHPVSSPALGIPRSFWYGGVSVGLGLMAVHATILGWLAWVGDEPERAEPSAGASAGDASLRLRWEEPAGNIGDRQGGSRS